MAARTDIHSPKSFQPQDYEYVDHFGYMKVGNMDRGDGESDFIHEPYGEEVMQDYYDRGDGKVNPHQDMFQCDICGARFVHGAGLIHTPTGLLVTVGGQCMEGIAGIGSLKVGQKWDRVKRDKKRREKAGKMKAMLVAYPGINAALKTDHYISTDLRAKVLEWGDLSEKQAALAFKLQKDVAERPPEADPKPVPTDGERRTVEGILLGIKVYDDDFGGTYEKMLVSVPVEGGAYKIFGSIPQALSDAQWEEDRKRLEANPENNDHWPQLKGSTITFACRMEASKDDPNFGFYSRPTKAKIIKWGDA